MCKKKYRDFGEYDPDLDLEIEDREEFMNKEAKEIEEINKPKWQK